MKKISTHIGLYALMLMVTFFIGSFSVYGQMTAGARVSTDKLDYPPGSNVIITGSGFAPNEAVTLQVVHVGDDPMGTDAPDHQPWTVSADAYGNVSSQWTVPLDGDALGATFRLTADGQISKLHAEWIFTDGTVTAATGGTNISADNAANATSPAFTTLANTGSGVMTYAESDAADLPISTNATLILTAPAGWEFNPGSGNVSVNGNFSKDITAASISVTQSTITITFTVASLASKDNITITNIQVRATDGASLPSAGNIYRSSSNLGNATMPGIVPTSNTDGTGGTNFGSLSQVVGAHSRFVITLPGQTFSDASTLAASGNSGTVTNPTAGAPFNIAIRATDQFFNVFIGFTGTTTISAAGGTLTLGSGATSAFTAGVLSSRSVTISPAATGVTLTATRTTGGTQSGTSSSFNVVSACTAPTLSSTITNVACFGTSTGAIALTVTGGSSPFTYSWSASNGGVVPAAQINNQNLTGLVAGTYFVTVTATGGCQTTLNNIQVTQPTAALALAASSKTDNTCFGASAGSVTAGAVTNAVGTVSYLWKNASAAVVGTTETVNNLAAGTYTVTVTDNCSSQSNNVTVGQPAAALALAASSKTDNTCYGASTGSVTAGAVTNAVGTVSYSWKNASAAVVGTTATVNNLAAGTYTVTVTDNCSSQSNSVTVGQPAAALALAASSKTDNTCYGASTGSVTAGAVTNAVGAVSYSWKNASAAVVGTTATVNNLAAGTYTVTVTDNCSSKSNSVTVGQPAAALALAASSKTDNTCYGASAGSVTAGAVTNAVGTVSYSWKNASAAVVGTTATVNNLAAGTYTVTVTDNCSSQSNSVTVGQPAAALALAASSKTDNTCYGASTGSVTAGAVTNAVGAVSYSWKNASAAVVGTTATVNNLAAGTYTVTVTDNCSSQSNSVTVGQPAAALALAASSKTDNTCYGASAGSVTAGAVTNAVGTVSYSWKNASAAVVGTTETVNNLAAGTYTVTVTDNCSSQSNSVTVGQPAAALALAASSKTDNTCYGASTGSVTAGAVTNAVGAVSYSWKNASAAVVGTTATVNNLAAGTYTVTVTDNCSSQSNSVTVGQPAAALALAASSKTDNTCYGASAGSVTAGAVTNAVGTVSYSWKNASAAVVGTTETVNNLAAGTYTVTVTDNCSSQSNSVTVGQPAAALALAASSKTDNTCYGASAGSVTAGAVTNAVGTVSYSWKNASAAVVGTTATVNNLAAGTYTVTVTDNCSSQSNSVTVGQPAAALALAASSKTDNTCYGASAGSVTAGAVTNAVGTVSYSWKNASAAVVGTTATVNNLAAGTYTVTVTDNCSSQSNSVTVGQPAAALALAASSKTDNTCFGASAGSVTAGAVTNAVGTVSYSWKNASAAVVGTTATVNNLAAGTYTVTVTDNCSSQSNSVTVGQPAAALALAASSKTDNTCFGASAGSVTAGAVTNAVGTVSYSWKNASAAVVGTTATVNNLAAGTYTVTVTDNCSSQSNSVTVGQPAAALALAASSKTDNTCYGASAGSVTAGAVTNAVGAVSYSWKNASAAVVGTTATVNNLAAGTYTVTVTDNCSSQSNSVTVGQPAAALALAASSKTDNTCFGASAGSVTAGAVTNAVGTVSYSWKNASAAVVGTTETVNNLAAGTYTVTVTDNCSSQSNSVTVGQPAAALALAASSKTDNTCYGASAGSVTAGAVTNAVGTVSYSWKNASDAVVGTTATVNNLAAGTYTVTVTDNCSSQSNSVTVGQPAAALALAASSKTDNTCYGASAGSVTAGAVTNAVGTVSYSWKNASAAVVGTTATVNNLAAGTYTVTVTDNCSSQSNSVTVGQPAAALALAASSKTDNTCFGASAGSVTAGAVTNAVGTVSYSWKNASAAVVGTTATVNNLAAGTYTVTVTDNCSSQSNSVTVGQPAAALALAASSKTDNTCFGASAGSVTAGAVTNAVGTVSYSWKNASAAVVGTTATVNNLAAGTYTVTVTDNCSSQSNSVTVGQPAAALALAASSKTDNTCYGASAGSVTAGAVTNAVGAVSYSWKNASAAVVGTTATVNNLAAGTYTVTVTDNCSSQSNSVTVGQPAAALALAASSKTDNTCFGASAGSVTAGAVTNAVGTVSYSWKNASAAVVGTTETVNNLAAGTYTVTVTDNCSSQSNSVTVGQPAAALALAASSKTDNTCYGASAGSVTAGAVTNAVGTVSYSWKNASDAVVGTTATVNNLAAGTYTVTVTDNCSSKSNSVTVGQPAAALALAASSKTDNTCYGASAGSVTAGAVTNAVGTVSYSWKNASAAVVGTTATVNNLAAGTYTVTVTDNCSSQSNSVTVGQPAAALALAASSKTDNTCYGASTGSVTAGAVTNAVGAVSYSWKNASAAVVGTTATVNNLAAGTYTVTVTDNCSSQSNSVTVGQPAAALALAASSKTDNTCYGASAGSVTAGAVTNAVGTVSYSWKNASAAVVGTTETVNNLAAGTYTVTVTDNCSSQSNSVTVGQPAAALALAASSKTDNTCYGASAGSVTAGAVTNAVGTVSYSWKNASAAVVGTTETVNNLAAGTYTVTVTDNCSSQSNSVTVGQPAAALALAASSKTDNTCYGASAGSVTAGAVTNAVGTVSYSWKNASAAVVGTTATVNNLAAGTYTVTVTDNCSSQSNSVTVGQPAAALALAASSKTDNTCYGASTGSVTAGAVTNAVGAVSYSWKNASAAVVGTTATVNNLAAGTYTVTVTDNCSSKSNSVTVGQPAAALALAASSKTDNTCYGASAGSVTAGAVTNAVGTVSYSWKNASAAVVGTTATVNNLAAGTYTVTVTDNCSSQSNSVTVGQPAAALALAASSKTDNTCYGASTGSVTAGAVTNAVGTVSYSWKNASDAVVGTTATVNNLAAGTYTVTVTDNCSSQSNSVTVGQPAAALALAASSKTDNTCYGASTGSVTAGAVTNAVGAVSYSWKNASAAVVGTTATVNNLAAGTYTVTVTDNCSSKSNSVTVGQPAAALALAASSKTDNTCYGASAGSVTAGAVTNAVGTVSYSWKNASDAVVGTTATVNNLAAGTYTVTVTDNCSSQSNSVTVGQPAAALALAASSKTDNTCYGASAGSVTAGAVTNAVGAVSYSWKNASAAVVGTTATVNNLAAGTYTVTVTDNCSSQSNSVTVGQPAAALALAASSKTDNTCYGASTGSVTAGAVTNAVGTVSYLWKNASAAVVGTTATVNNLAAGTYTVTVTDNCSSQSNSVTVGQPAAALALAASSKTDNTCFGASAGSVTAGAVTNAVGTVSYSWKNASAAVVGTTATVNNLAAGTYTVTVTDNCSSQSNSVTVGQPAAALIVSITSQTNIQCSGANSGSVTVAGANGTQGTGYQYKLGAGAYQASGTFGSLAEGSYLVTVKDANGCTASVTAVITKIATNALLTVTPGTKQYSDVVEFKAVITPVGGVTATCAAAEKVRFKVGAEIMGEANFTFNNSTKQFEAVLNKALLESTAGSMDPNTGAKTVTADLINISPAYTVTNPTSTSLTVTKEDARVEYTGDQILATGSTTSSATVTLRANILDITAAAISDPAYDAYPGDIRKAKVMFVNRDNGNSPISGWIPVSTLVDAANTKVATVSFPYTVTLAATEDDREITVGIIVGSDGYYTRDNQTDNVVVTVYKPNGDFITGGGTIIPTLSVGSRKADVGAKTNFGFSVKFTKSGNPKGNMNVIFRRTETDGKQHVYQIKSNAIQLLGVNASDAKRQTANFVTKSNLTDITNPNSPVSLGGNMLLYVNMVDYGEPATKDSISFVLVDGSADPAVLSNIVYSSNWVSSKTQMMNLSGGNLIVHSGFNLNATSPAITTMATSTPSVAAVTAPQQLFTERFSATAYPNPTVSYFTIKLSSGNTRDVIAIRVIDEAGRLVEMKNNLAEGQTIQIGQAYRSGIYFVEVMQGNTRRQLKLIKNK